jgi:mediator of RNA polymerase II transcription subunit 9
MIRFLLRYLANNEQLVQRLSESYIMRRLAQTSVSLFHRTKDLAMEAKLTEFTPERFKSFINSFKQNLKAEIENAKKNQK